MKINPDTIRLYIDQTVTKIELLKADIEAYRQHIIREEREVKTLRFLIENYENALREIGVDDETKVY
jgi:hypothetical protein